MKYTRKQLVKILEDANITTTAKSIAHLMIICMDNNLVSKEDIIRADTPKPKMEKNVEPKEKRTRGRPRINPPKEPTGYSKARAVRLTNQDTGEVTEYRSINRALEATGHGFEYFDRNNGKIIGGVLYEVLTPPSVKRN